MRKKIFTIKDLCIIGLIASAICLIAPVSIPIPLGLPMTLQTLIIALVAIAFGPKQSTTATLIYVALGSFGLPVFSNYTGGWQVLLSPTGGFILSFPLMAYIVGRSPNIYGLVAAHIVSFIFGTTMFCIISKSGVLLGITTCILPFIPITIIKAYLSYFLGIKIKKRINLFNTVD